MTAPIPPPASSQQQLPAFPQGLAESELFFLFDSLLEQATGKDSAQNSDRFLLAEKFLSGLIRVLGCQGAGFYQKTSSPDSPSDSQRQWTNLSSVGARSLGKPESNWLNSLKNQAQPEQIKHYPAKNWGQFSIPFRCLLVSDSPCLLVLSSRNPDSFPFALFNELKPLLENFCEFLARLSVLEEQTLQAQQQSKNLQQLLQTETLFEFLEQLNWQCQQFKPQARCALLIRPQISSADYILHPQPDLAQPLTGNFSQEFEAQSSREISFLIKPETPEYSRLRQEICFEESTQTDLETESDQTKTSCPLVIVPLINSLSSQASSWKAFLLISDLLPENHSQLNQHRNLSDFLQKLSSIAAFRLEISASRQAQITANIPSLPDSPDNHSTVHHQPNQPKTVWESLLSRSQQLAQTSLPVLITGESGTGKSQFAELIHRKSLQHQALFKALTCENLTPDKLEKWLFPSEQQPLKLESIFSAQNFAGTLFLKNVEQLPSETQHLLLSFLLKNHQAVPRLIVSTNEPLSPLVEQGKFLGTLENSLCQTQLHLPPLRQIPSEIPNLIVSIVNRQGHALSDISSLITSEGLEFLERFPWPGNLTQLENLVAMICRELPAQPLSRYDLELLLTGPGLASTSQTPLGLTEATLQFQREYIRQVIARCGGNMTEAAKTLDLHRSNLYRKMRQLEMSEAEQEENEGESENKNP